MVGVGAGHTSDGGSNVKYRWNNKIKVPQTAEWRHLSFQTRHTSDARRFGARLRPIFATTYRMPAGAALCKAARGHGADAPTPGYASDHIQLHF